MENMLFLLLPVLAFGQHIEILPNSELELINAEATCGICMFDMEGKSCELAIRFKGDSYYAKGAGIDDFGDAHAEEGFSNAMRRAEIQGAVVDKTFVLTHFKLKEEKDEALR